VRVKAPTKMPPPIRYLLSADRTLRRISLRKISTRVAKPTKSCVPKAHGRRHSSGLKNAARKIAISRVITVAMVCLAVAAALSTAGRPFHSADLAGTAPPPPTTASLTPVTPPPLDTKKSNPAKLATASTEKPTASPIAPQTRTAPFAAVASPVLKTSEIELPANAAPAETAPTAIVRGVDSVTITGCVESDNDTFWLKDTSGAEVPQSRSWKSGFFKKRPAAIELIDPTARLRLPSYVGQRVAATGTLTNREMRAHLVERVSGSCR